MVILFLGVELLLYFLRFVVYKCYMYKIVLFFYIFLGYCVILDEIIYNLNYIICNVLFGCL